MFKKMMVFGAACAALCCVAAPAPAEEAIAGEGGFAVQEPILSYSDDSGVTYKLSDSGNDGAFHLYLKADRAEEMADGYSVDGLNDISPAAGVQFKMDLDF